MIQDSTAHLQGSKPTIPYLNSSFDNPPAGRLETYPKTIIEVLNNHFPSTGKRLAKVLRSASPEHQSAFPYSSFTLHPESLDFVVKQLNQMRTRLWAWMGLVRDFSKVRLV